MFLNVLMPSTIAYDPIFVPLCISLWSQRKYFPYTCPSFFLSIGLPLHSATFHSDSKSDYDKINTALSVISIIITLARLYCRWFRFISLVLWYVSLHISSSVSIFERYTCHMIMVYYIRFILLEPGVSIIRGSCKKIGVAEKTKIRGGLLK